VAADIEEGAAFVVVAAEDDEGIAGDDGGEEVDGGAGLSEAAAALRGAGEDGLFFEGFDGGVAVPGGGDGVGLFQGIGRVVERQEVLDGLRHGRNFGAENGNWKVEIGIGAGTAMPCPYLGKRAAALSWRIFCWVEAER